MAAPALDGSTRIAIREGVIAQRLLDETVVLDPETGAYLRLNPAGRFVWERLDAPRTLDELARELADEYGIDPQRAGADVVAFARDLAGHGLAAPVG